MLTGSLLQAAQGTMELLRVDAIDSIVSVVSDIVVVWKEVVTGREMAATCRLVLIVSASHAPLPIVGGES